MSTEGADEFNYQYKVVMLGNFLVGKTQLMQRFTTNMFDMTYTSTQGVEWAAKLVQLSSGDVVRGFIWDTGGQEQHLAITKQYMRGAHGAMLVFDVTKKKTFEDVSYWLNLIESYAGGHVVVMLVGNKVDRGREREVRTEEAMALAEAHDLAYIETSALDGSGVNTAFDRLLEEIHRRCSVEEVSRPPAPRGGGSGVGGPGGRLDVAGAERGAKKGCCT
jgi:Ras-related protein Rab-11A/Ras-related protein Rab-11B